MKERLRALRSDHSRDRRNMGTPHGQTESVEPSRGDVLITSEAGRHFLSVVPKPHCLSFKDIRSAIEFARKWTDAKGCRVWHSANGTTARMPIGLESTED